MAKNVRARARLWSVVFWIAVLNPACARKDPVLDSSAKHFEASTAPASLAAKGPVLAAGRLYYTPLIQKPMVQFIASLGGTHTLCTLGEKPPPAFGVARCQHLTGVRGSPYPIGSMDFVVSDATAVTNIKTGAKLSSATIADATGDVVTALDWNANVATLTRYRGDQVVSRLKTGVPRASERLSAPMLADGWIVWAAPRAGRMHLFAQEILPTGIGPRIDAGEVFPQSAWLVERTCKTAEAQAVLLRGNTMTIIQEGKWSKPTPVGIAALPSAHSGGVLTCQGAEGTLTVTSRQGNVLQVQQARCHRGGCATATSRLEISQLGELREFYAVAVEVAGQTLVVWSGRGAGVRMRRAPLASLATARTQTIIADAGMFPLLNLFVRGNTAILALHIDGVRAWRISSSGEIAPVMLGADK